MTVPGFADTVVEAHKSLGAFSAYGHFRHYYFELSISGYQTPDTASTYANVQTFMNYYKQGAGL